MEVTYMQKPIQPDIEILQWLRDGIKWLTVTELANSFAVSVTRIRRWVRRGKIPCHRHGKRIIFFTHEIKPFVSLFVAWEKKRKSIEIS